MPTWDAQAYGAFADERGRPFVDLLNRVGLNRVGLNRVSTASPRTVVDLGCGPGSLTASLAERWPTAEVTGVDSSPEMIAAAAPYAGARVRFVEADLADVEAWRTPAPPDVVVSNAALQWVPEHRALLPAVVASLAPGGWLAFQVPDNADAPSHQALRAVAGQAPFAGHTAGVERVAVAEPADYLDDLAALGCRVDAWETTYLHVLTGPDPVLHWLEGTGARPYLQALPEGLRPRFTAALAERLAAACPDRPYGTVLAFRRIFVVAQRPVPPVPTGSTGSTSSTEAGR